MKKICLSLLSGFFFLTICTKKNENSDKVIANCHMPAIAKDKRNDIQVVYGTSTMYIFSKEAKSFCTCI